MVAPPGPRFGDDPQEFAVLLHIMSNGPMLTDQLHLRFAGWIFNWLAFWLGGSRRRCSCCRR
jgi:hypothetical protein